MNTECNQNSLFNFLHYNEHIPIDFPNIIIKFILPNYDNKFSPMNSLKFCIFGGVHTNLSVFAWLKLIGWKIDI